MLSPEQQKSWDKLSNKYRNVFSTSEGEAVLKDIVFNQLGCFRDEKTSEADIILSNVGMGILNLIGGPDAKLNMDNIVSALLTRPEKQ